MIFGGKIWFGFPLLIIIMVFMNLRRRRRIKKKITHRHPNYVHEKYIHIPDRGFEIDPEEYEKYLNYILRKDKIIREMQN